jgi:phytanoyl-CoA hydroxylase
MNSTYHNAIRMFAESGYVVFKSAISEQQITDFWNDVEDNLKSNPNLTFALHGEILKNSDIGGRLISNDTVLRIIDMEDHSERARNLMLHPVVAEFLTTYYETQPTAIQTLTYKYSSQQGAHSDMYLVSPPTVGADYFRESLAAAWYACERSDEENGALIIYPGSHRFLKKPLAYFGNNYGGWVEYLDEFCRSKGCPPEVFRAEKGDVLIWHGDLVHAGGRILNPGSTRKSLVVHYCRLSEESKSPSPSLKKVKHKNGWYFAQEAQSVTQ